MSPRIFVGILAVLVLGCASVPQFVGKGPSTSTPTCNSAADCEAKWSAARSYVLAHASYGIENDSVDRLETYDPKSDVTMGLRAKVSKTIQPDGSYAIVAKFWCNNLFECKPDADRTLEDFNRTIGAVGAAGATRQPIAANTPPAPVSADKHTNDRSVPPDDAEKYIRDSETAWVEGVAANDVAVVKRILAEDCIVIIEGRALDKAAAIAVASQAPGDLSSSHLDYATVRLFGDTAVVQGSDTWTRQGGRTGHFIWTDTWIRRNGQWQIVAGHISVTPMAVPIATAMILMDGVMQSPRAFQ
jgi:ketosteroid isomerase-like protein